MKKRFLVKYEGFVEIYWDFYGGAYVLAVAYDKNYVWEGICYNKQADGFGKGFATDYVSEHSRGL